MLVGRVILAAMAASLGGAGAFSLVPPAGARTAAARTAGRRAIALRASGEQRVGRSAQEREREGLLARREEVLRDMRNVLEVRSGCGSRRHTPRLLNHMCSGRIAPSPANLGGGGRMKRSEWRMSLSSWSGRNGGAGQKSGATSSAR